MKKFIFIFLALVCIMPFTGCNKNINYADYVSEMRLNVYLYENDGVSVKIYCSKREQPYRADGIKGDMADFCEVFVELDKNPQELEVRVGEYGGDMNYQAVENRYYLSFTAAPFTQSGVDVTLCADGKEETFTALTVTYEGVLSCEDALNCVVDYERELFENMTVNGVFDGEIYVRLLYDEGCYYYVGVCGKDESITAFLVDGERGKIIAKRSLQG